MQTDNIFQPQFDNNQLSGYNPFSEPVEIRGNQVFGTRYGMYLGTVGPKGFRSSYLEGIKRDPNFDLLSKNEQLRILDEQARKENLLRGLFRKASKRRPQVKPPKPQQTPFNFPQGSANSNIPQGSAFGPITQKGNSLFRDGVFLGSADASANPMSAVQQSLMGSGATNPSYSSPLFG